jgi:hypothetical protein
MHDRSPSCLGRTPMINRYMTDPVMYLFIMGILPRQEGDRSCICLSWVSYQVMFSRSFDWWPATSRRYGPHPPVLCLLKHLSTDFIDPSLDLNGLWLVNMSWVSYQDRKVIGHASVYHGYPTRSCICLSWVSTLTGRWSVMYLFIMHDRSPSCLGRIPMINIYMTDHLSVLVGYPW